MWMWTKARLSKGAAMLAEIQEFGSFGTETQRYLCRSLHVAFAREFSPSEWARNESEAANIQAQMRVYKMLPAIRSFIPEGDRAVDAEAFLSPLIAASVFDLSSSCITTFAEYAFLYERLLGAAVRPWLPSSFAAAAAMPCLPKDDRLRLLSSLSPGLTDQWSADEPGFFPEFLEA
jgi:hypothetical protein